MGLCNFSSATVASHVGQRAPGVYVDAVLPQRDDFRMRHIVFACGLAALLVVSGCGSSSTTSGTSHPSSGAAGASGTNGSSGHSSGNTTGSGTGNTSSTNGTTTGNGSGTGGGNDGGGCGLRTCQSANADCGPVGDGCGGELQCGDCAAPETCGGGGAERLRRRQGCVPTTCAALGLDCGPAGDGCGGCSTAALHRASDSAAAAGPTVRRRHLRRGGVASCTPRDCAAAGANCGPVADGCGGLLELRHLQRPGHLRRRRQPSVCGWRPADGGLACTNLCLTAGVHCGGGDDQRHRHGVRAQRRRPALQRAGLRAQRAGGRPSRPGVACDAASDAGLGLAAGEHRHRRRRQLHAHQHARRRQHPAGHPARPLAAARSPSPTSPACANTALPRQR